MTDKPLYVIVDRDNSRIADCESRQGGKRFISYQGMAHRWSVKLRADWEK